MRCGTLRWLGAVWMALLAGHSMGHGEWQAAAHAERLEPVLPISMAGSMTDQVARRIHDPIHVRALMLNDGTMSVAFVVCDSCMIERSVVDRAKELVKEETGIDPDHVVIAATHSHSCPASARVFQTVPDERYQQQLIEAIATSVATCQLRIERATVSFGVATCSEEVFNRRWKMKPGVMLKNPLGGTDQVQMNPPLGSTNLLEPAGPTDVEIPVLWVQAADGEPMGLLANYSLHYVGGVPAGEISADYFGEFCRLVGERWRPAGARRRPVAILSNGSSGDINNIDVRGSQPTPEPLGPIRRVATRVAERSLATVADKEGSRRVPSIEPKLGCVTRELELEVRKPAPTEVAEAQKIVEKAKGRGLQSLEEIYAGETLALAQYPDRVSVPVQGIRVGPVAFVAIPCEVFVEVGLEIKRKSPFKETVILELANGYFGYLPTPYQHQLGGYETWRAKSSFLETEASTKIVQASLEILQRLEFND